MFHGVYHKLLASFLMSLISLHSFGTGREMGDTRGVTAHGFGQLMQKTTRHHEKHHLRNLTLKLAGNKGKSTNQLPFPRPWVASIGGGIHTSYTAIGQPQVQPILADPRRSARSTPPAPAAPGFELKVAIPSAHGLADVGGTQHRRRGF